jgi:predicted site-specific integrase-resolvase
MGFETAGKRDRILIGYARVSTDEQSLDLHAAVDLIPAVEAVLGGGSFISPAVSEPL